MRKLHLMPDFKPRKRLSYVLFMGSLSILIILMSCNEDRYLADLRRITLNEGWEFREEGKDTWLAAEVPGCIHTDLLMNGLIPDPFFGTNEADLQWPGEREWEYRLLFDRPEGFPEDDDIHLVFQGLDTYASAWLNGEEILKADNMFVEWETDVSNLLKDHDNELLLRFIPVHSMDSLRISRAGLDPVTDYAVHRKAAYHFGWDWGPRFLTMGIWQDVFLESRPQARIADVFIRQDSVSKDVAVLSALIDLEGALSAAGRIVAVVNGNEWKIDVPEGDLHDIVMEMRLEQPMLWYPRGMGQQHLTEFSFSLVMDDEVLHEQEVITGLRRLELNQEPDSCGRSFAFSVNGQAVFARGANLIPLDMFPSRVEPEEYEALLHLAANAGVNMLRIWGGGIYEKEQLYDLCDRLGILIWQDFMFACSMYPADSHFMNSVALEAGQQVRRLRNHPSIAIWCGNNENWVGWNNWGWQEKYSAPERVKAELDYASLFDSLLLGVVARYDPGKPYWPSSPLHNWAREDVWDGGDLHYWGVWHGEEPFEAFTDPANIGRFVSEFGMQSFPAWQTLPAFVADDRYRMWSADLAAHQKHRVGFPVIDRYMETNYFVPSGFQDYVHISRALQAYGMEMAIAAHRRHTPCCAGSLFWQWNDVWPGITWSAIDGEGVPKPLYHRLHRLYDDVLLQGVVEQGNLQFYVSSDTLVGETQVSFRILAMNGTEIHSGSIPIKLKHNGTESAKAGSLKELLHGLDPGKLFWTAETKLPDGRVKSVHGYFVKPKYLHLGKAEVKLVLKSSGDHYTLEMSANELVKDLEIVTSMRTLISDNGFDLLPGQTYVVRLFPREKGISPDIDLWSLNDAVHRN